MLICRVIIVSGSKRACFDLQSDKSFSCATPQCLHTCCCPLLQLHLDVCCGVLQCVVGVVQRVSSRSRVPRHNACTHLAAGCHICVAGVLQYVAGMLQVCYSSVKASHMSLLLQVCCNMLQVCCRCEDC